MEEFFTGGVGYLVLCTALLFTIALGIMAFLLPFMVFRLLGEVKETNKKITRIIPLLKELKRQGQSAYEEQAFAGEASRGVTGGNNGRRTVLHERPLRFQ